MKKTFSFLLALLLFALPCFALAEAGEGIDPAAAVEGMLKNVNGPLNGNVTVLESDTPGVYNVYYQAADMGCYMTIGSADSGSGAGDRLSVSEIFVYTSDTSQMYLTFFLAVSAALEQYVTGEEFSPALTRLSETLSTAMSTEGYTAGFTAEGCSVTVSVETGSGMILLEFEMLV